MSRPAQWEPLCESDPVPGDAYQVGRAGRHYSSIAEEIEAQVSRLSDIAGSTLRGEYVQALTTAAEGLKDGLGQISGRYREVGGALGAWAGHLEGFQDEAEQLRVQAIAAQGDMDANRVVAQITAVNAPPASDAVVAAAKARAGRYDDAGADLRRVQARLVDLTERRDEAAGKIAEEIRQDCDDGVRDSAWDNFMDWMDQHHEQVSGLCKVLGVIAMAACVVALVVPGLNVAAAAALTAIAIGASSGSLLGHSALAVSGHGSWVDVGMDVFALATLGAGRFLGPGVKVFGKTFGGALGRLTAETKAAGAVARGKAAVAPIQAEVNAGVAQARERLVGSVSRRTGRSVRLQVKAIRKQGSIDRNRAFDAAHDAYSAQKTATTFEQRLRFGGGDRDLATMRVEAKDASFGFSDTSKVGLAAAKADNAYKWALTPTAANTLAGAWNFATDQVAFPAYDNWRDRWPTKVKGAL